MNKSDKKFLIFVTVFAICLTLMFVFLEVYVQRNWDRYEENVMIERGIK